LCLRVKWAHELGQHASCFQFSCESLRVNPACHACLDVYIAHVTESSPLCSFRASLISKLNEVATPLAMECLLRLAEMGRGVGGYRQLMAELKR
jgi:hypothetical protein